jgi:hypothetical protein
MQTDEIRRVAASALRAALQEEPERDHASEEPSHRLRDAGAIAAGAALVTGARAGYKHLPRLRKLRLLKHGLGAVGEASKLEGFTDALRDKFADRGHDDGGSEPEDYQGDAEDYQGDEQAGEEAEGNEQQDHEEAEDLPSEQGGEDGRRGETPDLVAALSEQQSRPPVMERMAAPLDPAARPPKAAGRRRSQSRDGARSGSKRKKQSTAG